MSAERPAIKPNFLLARTAEARHRNGNPFQSLIRHWGENIGGATKIEYEEGAQAALIQGFRNGYVLELAGGPHTGLFDGIIAPYVSAPIVRVANEHLPRDQRLETLLEPFSQSIPEGKRGFLVTQGYYAFEEPMLRHNLTPVFTTTDHDKQNGEQTQRQDYWTSLEEALSDGHHGIFIFPEGTIDAGRRDPKTGQKRGLRGLDSRIKTDAFTSYPDEIRKATGRETMIVPFGISGLKDSSRGANEVFNPDNSRPSIKSVLAGLAVPGFDPRLLKVRIGVPVFTDDPKISEMLNDRSREGRATIRRFFAGEIERLAA